MIRMTAALLIIILVGLFVLGSFPRLPYFFILGEDQPHDLFEIAGDGLFYIVVVSEGDTFFTAFLFDFVELLVPLIDILVFQSLSCRQALRRNEFKAFRY